MRAGKTDTKHIGPGRIMHINPAAELASGNGQIAIVTNKHTWGCDVSLPDGNVVPVAWQHLEDTGGTVVWAPDGQRFTPPAPALTHHP